MKSNFDPTLHAARLLSVLTFLCVSVYADAQQTPTTLPPYVYPFPLYPNVFIEHVANQSSDTSTFLDGVPWPSDDTNATSRLFGSAANNVVTLSLQVDQGTWELRPVDGASWTLWTEPYLTVSALPTDVYEVHVTPSSSGQHLPSFWAAWPRNAILPDRFQPTGAVHGEIVGRKPSLGFHVWGYVRDDMQTALGGSGIAQAQLWIDNEWSSVALDTNGVFNVTTPHQSPEKRVARCWALRRRSLSCRTGPN